MSNRRALPMISPREHQGAYPLQQFVFQVSKEWVEERFLRTWTWNFTKTGKNVVGKSISGWIQWFLGRGRETSDKNCKYRWHEEWSNLGKVSLGLEGNSTSAPLPAMCTSPWVQDRLSKKKGKHKIVKWGVFIVRVTWRNGTQAEKW